MAKSSSALAIRTAREAFIGGEDAVFDAVRRPILDSWKRSKAWQVDADRLELRFVREPNLESPFARAALPVTSHLVEDLAGQSVGVILATADGMVLDRTRDGAMSTAFDTLGIETGYSCAEEFVGTNAVGAALESREPVTVQGSEHYVENLSSVSCVGVPIVHPISGSLLGALDLTCPVADSRPLLSALAQSTVRSIESRILEGATVRERALFEVYQRTCRRTTKGVLAVGGDVVLANTYVQKELSKHDQAVLVGHAVDLLVSSIVQPLTVRVPSGRSFRLVPTDAGIAGSGAVVFTVAAHEPKTEPALAAVAPPKLPGVAGSSTSWRRSCAEVVSLVRTGRWVLVEGEAGVGRGHLLGVAATENLPGRGPTMIAVTEYDDHHRLLADVLAATDSDEFRLVLRDLDALDPAVAEGLSVLLEERRASGWVGGTVGAFGGTAPSSLLEIFERVVPVTALRHRIGDLDQLVPHLLAQLTQGSGPILSVEAAAQFARYGWPGNVAQLRRILSQVVHKQRSGTISVDALPAECRAVTRRRLTQIEALQRDAIVASLHDNAGDKKAAAAALGISRATIYRRFRQFGIS
ncbi:MAG: GAF domain-containing protein [Rhodococcus sp.]|nr:GAF domain-containing protein [Rhodococcus sp. (in: high G+C Gram-positive bacteria)]